MLGRSGAHWVTLTIMVSMIGSANGMVLAGARVYYAMAKDGLFFRWCGAVLPRFRTPHLALGFQCLWAICLVLVGTYQQLFTCVIFAGWIFYGLSVYAVIVLRRKRPDLARPFRVWGYPLVPIVFVLGASWVIANMLVEKPIEAGIGGLMIVLGVPVYWLWRC
jgi:APA family basic amino acid/polyamine antiporter